MVVLFSVPAKRIRNQDAITISSAYKETMNIYMCYTELYVHCTILAYIAFI